MPDNPNIIGGSRVAWTAAIVLICILLFILVVELAILGVLLSPSGPAAADPHVVAGFLKG